MRISILAVFFSTLWLATGRAQESSSSMNNAAGPGKTVALPNMPAPKPRQRCVALDVSPSKGRAKGHEPSTLHMRSPEPCG